MRKFVLLLLSGSMLFLTSCFDIFEDVYLNKDGSGEYITKIDASGLFSNPFMKSAIEEAAKEEGGEEVDLETDSTMYYKDMAGFSSLTEMEQKKVKDLNIHMKMSESNGEFLITSKIPFASLEELAEIQAIIGKVQDKEGDGGGLMGGSNPFVGATPRFKQGKRELVRLPELAGAEEEMDEETMSMAKMFFTDAKSTTVYHLPGKVKNSSIPNSVVDGKTVTVTHSLLDLMDKKVSAEGAINYKKK
jgi:hypothetical protein